MSALSTPAAVFKSAGEGQAQGGWGLGGCEGFQTQRPQGSELSRLLQAATVQMSHPPRESSHMVGLDDFLIKPVSLLFSVERTPTHPLVTGVAAAAGGSAGLVPEATAGAGAGAVTQAEESSQLEARQSAVQAVAHERLKRNRAVDVVADEPGDDLFVEVREPTRKPPLSEGNLAQLA